MVDKTKHGTNLDKPRVTYVEHSQRSYIYQSRYNTWGKALAVAGDWLDVGTFLCRSRPVLAEPVMGESTVSGNPSATMDVLDVGGSAGATPFTSTGADGS